MLNINKLLKKKKWTGKDLGRLELVTVLDMFDQSMHGVASPKPLITDGEMLKMLETITDTNQIRIYNDYLAIHEWFSSQYNNALYVMETAKGKLAYFRNILAVSMKIEDTYRLLEQMPVIVTKEEYETKKNTRIQEILNPDGKPAYTTLFNVIVHAIDYYIEIMEKKDCNTKFKSLKKMLKEEIVTDNTILKNYNKVMHIGYYVLPDGKKITKEAYIDLLKEAEKTRDTVDQWKQRYYEEEYKESVEAKWTCSRIQPKNITQWDILSNYCLEEYYTILQGVTMNKEKALGQVEAFYNEFKRIVDVVLLDIENHFKVDRENLSTWLKEDIKLEDLYKEDLYGFRETYTNDAVIYDGNYNAVCNGVAIINSNHYTQPTVTEHLENIGLGQFFTDSEYYAHNIEVLEANRKLLLDSIYYMKGHNYALDLIAKTYDLEEIEVGKIDVKHYEKDVEEINRLIYMLYTKINQTHYEDAELKKKKMEVLKDVFTPICLDGLEIPEDVKAKADEDVKDFHAFKDINADLRLTLCYRYSVNEEGVVTW